MLTARALMTLLRAMMGVAANLLLAVLLHWRETESLYQENNLLENLQLAALAGCVLVYGLRARRGVDGYARLQLGALAVLSACMFYRESDFHWLLPEGTRAYAIAYVIHRGAFVLGPSRAAGCSTGVASWISSTPGPACFWCWPRCCWRAACCSTRAWSASPSPIACSRNSSN